MAASAIESHVDDLAFDLEILVGTYEEFVLGFKLSHNSEGVSRNLIQTLH